MALDVPCTGPAPSRFPIVAKQEDGDRLREELAVQKHQKAIIDSKTEAGEVERRQLEALRLKMGNNHYAFNHCAEIVPMAAVDTKNLPRTISPFVSQAEHLEHGSRGKNGNALEPRASTQSGKKGASGARSKRQQLLQDFVERPRDSGSSPMVAIELQPGAVLKSGAAQKAGATRKEDHSNMTRSEFQLFAERKLART